MPCSDNDPARTPWLALAIGNTHYHWGKFRGHQLLQAWDTPHPEEPFDFKQFPHVFASEGGLELWLASVVPAATAQWLTYPHLHQITLADVPLANCYATLGIDRALAAWGAYSQSGGPLLLIDGGTALTITGVDGNQTFRGGAILPGLGLMASSLREKTAALPKIEYAPECVPVRWGLDTVTAIQSGIFYTVLAGVKDFIADWLHHYPQSQLVFTGGSGKLLWDGVRQNQAPALAALCRWEPQVILGGIAAVRNRHLGVMPRPGG